MQFFIFLYLIFTYSSISWRPIVSFFREHEFHAFFFFFLKFDHPILDFLQIKFYIETQFWKNWVTKNGISLISLGNEAKGYIICVKRAFAQIPLYTYQYIILHKQLYGPNFRLMNSGMHKTLQWTKTFLFFFFLLWIKWL